MVQEIKLNQIDSVVTTVGTPGTDGNLPTEKAVRDAIIAGGGSVVSDAAYGAGWNGVTTIAPSKNSVYDYLESLFPGGVVPISGAAIAGSTFTGYTNTATISTNGGVETTYATKTSHITGTVTCTFNNFSFGCTLRIRKNGTQVLISGGLGSVTGAVAVVPGDVITFTAQIPGPEGTQPGTVKSITFSLDYTSTFS